MKEQKNRTVLEWFEHARDLNYRWADTAIGNHKAAPLLPRDHEFPSLRLALIYGFSWETSPQGNDFWDKASDKL